MTYANGALHVVGVTVNTEASILRRTPTYGYGASKMGTSRAFPACVQTLRQLSQGGLQLSLDEAALAWAREEHGRQQRAKQSATNMRPIEGMPFLLPYQAAGIRFLRSQERVLLGDDTGLGKTMMSLLAAKPYLEAGGNVLVVTVKGLIPQWEDEIQKWEINPPGGVINLSRSNGRKDKFVAASMVAGAIVLINWDALTTLTNLLSETHWTVVIGDEAHLVKNHKAMRSRAMAKLSKEADNVWLMTGTPQEKAPDNLWMLLHILYPERFTSYWAFFNAFVRVTWDGRSVARNVPILHDIMRSFYIRRLRVDELKDIKEPQIIPVSVTLEKEELALYKQIEMGAFIAAGGAAGEGAWEGSTSIVGRLIHARQAAISPSFILPEFTGESSKMQTMLALLAALEPTDRAVIFSSFRAPCEVAAQKIGSDAVVYFADRSPEIYQRFARGEGPRFLVTTPSSLGLGANLQVARAMVFLDTPWSLTQFRQGAARIVRIGQVYAALIYQLVAKGTVDEDVLDLISRKQASFSEVVVARRVLDRLKGEYDAAHSRK